MSDSTRLGDVVDEGTAGASELVVEGDGCGEAAEAGEDAFSETGECAGAVAFEREQVFAGPEDRFGIPSDRRFLAVAAKRLSHLFPRLPKQPGYFKRRRKLADTLEWLMGVFAGQSPGFYDDLLLIDSTPVECARSRETVKRSDLAGWAEYGYCASHSRWFWGLRLHLACTLHGLPVAFALAGAKGDERQVLLAILDDESLLEGRAGQVIIADKGYYGRDFEAVLAAARLTLLRPARKGEPEPAGRQYFRPLRQVIESVNDTLKGQLDLERHGGRTVDGVTTRMLQRILALTAAIWHNDATGQPVMRSLVAYDH